MEATLQRSLKPHPTPVSVLAVDRTSTLLATGGTDGALKVWDIAGGYVTHSFRGPSALVSALRFFEVTSRGEDEGVGKKSKKAKVPRADEVIDDTAGTTRFRLASATQDGKVRVWDLHKRKCLANLDYHVSEVRGLEYCPSQNALVTTSRDKTMIWWDSKSWKRRQVATTLEYVEGAGFIGTGRLTYTVGSRGCLRLWETDTGREVTEEQAARAESDAFVSSVYLPELSLLFAVRVNHDIEIFRLPDVDDNTPIHALPALEPFRTIPGTYDEVIDLAYLLPDRSLLAVATNSEFIRLLAIKPPDTAANGDAWSTSYFGQDVACLRGHDDIIISLDVDWSGHWVATGAKDNTARLWRIDPAKGSFTCHAVFAGHTETIGAVALPKTVPADGSAAHARPLDHPPPFLITASQDQTVKRWDIPREAQSAAKPVGRALFTRKAHDKDINALDIHENSQLFASASQDKTVKIWSCREGEVQGILRGHKRGVWSVRFSPKAVGPIQGEEGTSSNKGVVLTGSGDKTVKIWNLSDYTCLRTFEGHTNSILKVAWLSNSPGQDSGDRRAMFASAGSDGLVKVWDANQGETACTLDNHEDRVWALAVDSQTNTIVSGSSDSTIVFWFDRTEATRIAETEAAARLVEQEQEFENHVSAGAYREAVALALQLNHPGRLLSLFTSVVTTANPDEGSITGLAAVDDVLANLSDDQLFILLLRLRDWNTNARTAPVAQRVLAAIVRSYPAARLAGLAKLKGATGQRSLAEVIAALAAYTERHYKRIEDLVDESYLVEYTLREMDSLAPPLAEDEMEIDVP